MPQDAEETIPGIHIQKSPQQESSAA